MRKFTTTYPRLICASGYLGCKTGKHISPLGCSTSKGKEWTEMKVVVPNEEKTGMLKALRKKIAKPASSKNRKDATMTISKQVIESSILLSKMKSESLTEKCIHAAYYVGYHNRLYTDYEHLVHSSKRKMVLI